MVLTLVYPQPTKGLSTETIYVRPDGSVNPSTAPIDHIGDLYNLTNDIGGTTIILERNNTVFDGSAHTLQGTGSGLAINITGSNVTVRNTRILNWETGIFGAYSNNTVYGCYILDNARAMVINGDDYTFELNYLTFNQLGISIQGNSNHIFKNQIHGSEESFNITSPSSGNIIEENNIENNRVIISSDNGQGFSVYHNNFIGNGRALNVAIDSLEGGSTVTLPYWDNGFPLGGNYWSYYETTSPNAKEINASGIWDIPYAVSINPNVTDRYPLIRQFDIINGTLSSPSPSPSPSQTATTPSPQPEPTTFNSELVYAAVVVGIAIAITAVVVVLRRIKQSNPR